MPSSKEVFLSLVRMGICHTAETIPNQVNWPEVKALADRQGLSAIILDGIEQLPNENRPPKDITLPWIGEGLQMEARCDVQTKAADTLGELFHENSLRTYVLKGIVVAECYPNPKHRLSADMDCFLLPLSGDEDAWKKGNDLVREKGFDVSEGFYKNSTFHLPGLMVENHKFMTPFRGSRNLKRLENVLQALIPSDEGEDRINGTWLYRPPVMMSSFFLIEHAYSHFLHEGLTWRMVLDWMLFIRKHRAEIDWVALDAFIDEFRLRKFYDSFYRLGKYLLGELSSEDLEWKDKQMLEDIWAPLDLHESLHGVKAKFQLAGNYWRARCKYKYFTDTTWARALMEWVLGAVFERQPKLD